jgi:hypothetical protein
MRPNRSSKLSDGLSDQEIHHAALVRAAGAQQASHPWAGNQPTSLQQPLRRIKTIAEQKGRDLNEKSRPFGIAVNSSTTCPSTFLPL